MCDACDTQGFVQTAKMSTQAFMMSSQNLAVPGSALNVAAQTTQMLAPKAYHPFNQKIDPNSSMKVENLTRLLQ